MSPNKIIKTDAEWRAQLNDFEFAVLREAATERPWTGALLDEKRPGVFKCRACGTALFGSGTKFDSHCGWPSFDDEIPGAVKRTTDADGDRTEITCTSCGGHLGHVFLGERFTPKDTRHCVNSLSLRFVPAEKQA